MLLKFIKTIIFYIYEILPPLVIGFFISGIVHEFLSLKFVNRYLRSSGFKGIFYATLIGTIVPVCCWGSLPIAITLRKKGSFLGPVFSILIATPATSINALIITWKLLGGFFSIFLFISVIITGIIAGVIGNKILIEKEFDKFDFEYGEEIKKRLSEKIKCAFKYSFFELPREIWKECLLGIFLAGIIDSFFPISYFIKNYLIGYKGYIFAVIVGILMYMCATMSVPIVHALIKNGMEIGAAFSFLMIGPITSYGTLLVLRKEFGLKILIIYLLIVSISGVLFGYIFSLLSKLLTF
jgi:uncharacterized membrane protein YraQ (UPF0718 family)